MNLSTRHEPISELFKYPSSSHEWADYALNSEQLQGFEQNGFLPGIRILDPAQLEQLTAELDKVLDPEHPGHSLFYEFHLNEAEEEDKVLSLIHI